MPTGLLRWQRAICFAVSFYANGRASASNTCQNRTDTMVKQNAVRPGCAFNVKSAELILYQPVSY